MAKKFPPTAQVERLGVALSASVVAEMRHIWREKSVSDVGIDGEIELVDLATSNALGRLLLVQSKARTVLFDRETSDAFSFRCTEDDIDYWLSASTPVLLICSHPSDGEAWFKNVSLWFADPEHRRSRVVDFDKRADRFDAAAARTLLDWGVPASTGIYLRPPPRAERLLSNLLRVEHISKSVHFAPTGVQGWKDINDRLRNAGYDLAEDVVWRERQIYSFRRFDVPPLDVLADDTPERIATDELANSKSDDDKRLLVRLLNNTLRELAAQLHWNHSRKYLYFPASKDLEPYKVRAAKNGSGRTVFARYYDKETSTRVVYYRHYTLRFQFLRNDDGWFLALRPTYHFTYDGHRESQFAGQYLKKIKQIEGHGAVASTTKFWAGYLRTQHDLFANHDQRLRFGLLAELDLDHGIDDAYWKPRPKDKSLTDDVDDIDVQTSLEGLD